MKKTKKGFRREKRTMHGSIEAESGVPWDKPENMFFSEENEIETGAKKKNGETG